MLRTSARRDFYVMQTKDEVWIDVSEFETGDGGNRVYSAVADYALNTGRQFIGDPAGLSFVALRRRTDAMLSSALKHGTSRHTPTRLRARPAMAFRASTGRMGKILAICAP